jgi:hypothetical protein
MPGDPERGHTGEPGPLENPDPEQDQPCRMLCACRRGAGMNVFSDGDRYERARRGKISARQPGRLSMMIPKQTLYVFVAVDRFQPGEVWTAPASGAITNLGDCDVLDS